MYMKALFADKTRALFVVLGSLLVLFIAVPLLRTVTASSPVTLWQTLLDEKVQASIALTFTASLAATVIAFVTGVPLAYLLARADFPGKRLVEGVVDLPIVVPHSAAGIALLMVFGRRALLGQAFGSLGIRFVSAAPGIVIAMLFVSLSFLVSSAREGFESVDPRLERVARTLGASPWTAFRRVAFPLAWRSILSGMILMWARGLSEFGAVVILAYHPMVAPVLLYERFESFGLAYARPVATLIILICLATFVALRAVAKESGIRVRRLEREGRESMRKTRKRVCLPSLSRPFADFALQTFADEWKIRRAASVEIRDLSVDLGEFHLREVDLDIAPGEYFIVLGPTGGGKTVLLETIAGLHPLGRGHILLDGEEITTAPPERRGIGFVYQDYALFPHLSVARNIGFGLELRGERRPAVERRVDEMARLLSIEHLLHRSPGTLSGGEQQRVALARALIVEPRLLLLDEPLSALDPATREELQRDLARLHAELGTTTLHVTHDFEEAVALGDRIAVLNGGRVVQVGTTEKIFRKPVSEFVAHFVGVRNIFQGELRDGEDGYKVLPLDGIEIAVVTEREGRVHASIRPEDILISRRPLHSSARNSFQGRIVEIADRGTLIYVTVRVPFDHAVGEPVEPQGRPSDFTCAITRRSLEELELTTEQEVCIAFKASAVHTF